MIINYFNPKGISLIRTQQDIKWAPDSLFIQPEIDSTNSSIDKTIPKTTAAKESVLSKNQQENRIVNNTTQKQANNKSESIEQKETEKKTDTSTFEEPQAINLQQAYSLFKKGIVFIDARDESDFLAGHITNSINIPFDDFDNHKQKLKQISKLKPVVVYCAGTECDLSHLLANLLFEKEGYKQVYVFFGGWGEWLDAKYPIEQSLGNSQ